MGATTFSDFFNLNEIETKPVPIEWFYQQDGIWYGSFIVGDKDYDICFYREDKPHNIDLKIVSLKFSRPNLKDPHAFAKDFNKPIVVANTVASALAEYLETQALDVFVIKAYNEEVSRVRKYRELTSWLKNYGKFFATDEVQKDNYTYFLMFKNSSTFGTFRNDKLRNYISNQK